VLRTCGLPNAYCLTKHMTERLVLDAGADPTSGFGVAVVRPSIVGAIARAPCPGYFGNASGCTSYFLAYSLGHTTFTCHRATSVFDLVPGDVVASVVLAAGAAVGHAAAAKKAGGGAAPRGPPLILHAAASTTNPITHLHFFRDHVNPYYEVRGRGRKGGGGIDQTNKHK
jgi:fatty acyl-CoA reductase